MSSETPISPPAKPAIDSLTLKSVAAIAIAFVAGRLEIALPEGLAQELASSLVDLIITLGLVGVAIGRARARGPII